MPTIIVKTTTGDAKVDPADIDSLTYRVGDKERTVEGDEVLAMFHAFMAADEAYQARQRHEKQIDSMHEENRKLREVARRQILGE